MTTEESTAHNHSSPVKPIGLRLAAAAFFVAIIVSAALLLAVQRSKISATDRLDPKADLAMCEQKTLTLLANKINDLQGVDGLSNHCIGEVSNSYRLADYEVRRSAFEEQYHEGQFILWLVISVTVSGVVLASIQLLAAYNMSIALNKDMFTSSSLELEAKSVSLRSTVSGLIILAMSFAFFQVYVIYVYPVEITDRVSLQPDTLVTHPQPPSIFTGPNTLPQGTTYPPLLGAALVPTAKPNGKALKPEFSPGSLPFLPFKPVAQKGP